MAQRERAFMKREDVARCIGICCLIWMGPLPTRRRGLPSASNTPYPISGRRNAGRRSFTAISGLRCRNPLKPTGGFPREEALLAVEKYRERFREKGMFENKVYPGVEKLLWTLRDAGRVLAVATSKPEVFAKKILGHFGLSEYFQEIVGSELDGTRMDKAEVIREAFARLALEEADKPLTAMIGDRKHDIVGAKKNGIASVGVAFGYAEEGELEEAGADRIVASVSALRKLLLAW